jgi:hypothetical protein
MKTAKIIWVSLATRVIVDTNDSEEIVIEKAIEQAKDKFIDKINNELYENIDEIFDDTDCPYDQEIDN